jgi:hypothetical protein
VAAGVMCFFKPVVRAELLESCDTAESKPARQSSIASVHKTLVKDPSRWSTIGVVEKHYNGEVPEALQQGVKRMEAATGPA